MTTEKGRYSRVSRRIWNDGGFRELSQPKPCGAWLFFRLLTGPELTNIPGLFQAWEAGLAQALGWSLKDFKRCFGEVKRQGLADADWTTGLVWLPKAISHNEPESVNVVIGWRSAWQELPDCELKAKAGSSLMAWAMSKGEAWAKAYAKATGLASPIQEQEQEQEQEQKPPNPHSPKPGAFAMHVGWRPSETTRQSFDVSLIPRWAQQALIDSHRSHFVADPTDFRTDAEWNQSCSRWVHTDWNNPKKRPKQPEEPVKADPFSDDGSWQV